MSQEAIITCRDLCCGYSGQAVLRDVTLEVMRGEILALLGGSGSGKSTLLRTIVGLLPPLRGEVRLLGEDPYALGMDARQALLRRTGMLFQYGALFGSRTILDNVALPLRTYTKLPEPVIAEMVRQRLELLGLTDLEGRLPADVSGGQRKRVALARATIMDPEVVFCDEPSAGLDPVVAAGLDETLRWLQRKLGVTIVAVTHELASIRVLADRVVMLHGGEVRAVGTVPELDASDDPVVRAFFHREPPVYAAAGETVLDQVGGGGRITK